MPTLQNITFIFTIMLFFIIQNKIYSEEKKFKIIAEEIPIHSFYETPKTDTIPNPKIIGSDIEIAKKIFDKLKIPYEIQLIHWTQILPMLKTGETHIALGIRKNKAIDKYVDYTRTPMRTKTYSFFGELNKKNKVKTMTFENALKNNFTVGIRVGFTYPKEFWKVYPFENYQLNHHLVESHSFKENIIKLKEKKIDLFLADRERVSVLLNTLGAEETIFQYKNILYWKDYFLVFSKKIKDPNLNSIKLKIERELYKMAENNEISDINKYWIKKELKQ